MPVTLSGATRLHIIVGDPIAQVKSPGGMTAAFAARGSDAILVPVQVAPADLKAFLDACDTLKNLDGIIATVPHKFACFAHCSSTTERARILGACNIMRRDPAGGWHGDAVDGLGFVAALRSQGIDPGGRRALLVGAGGAGSAIGLALLDAGASALAIHDADPGRRDDLVRRLGATGKAPVMAGSADPAGYDIVANASPAGMKAGDPLPVDVSRLTPDMAVGCVITVPAVSPLVAAARAIGCRTSTGTQMYEALQSTMVDFLLSVDRA